MKWLLKLRKDIWWGPHGRKPRITFTCERSGVYRGSLKTNNRNESKKEEEGKLIRTKKCGCLFTFKGVKLTTNDDWMLVVKCGRHNHSHIQCLEGYSFASRLSEEEMSILVEI